MEGCPCPGIRSGTKQSASGQQVIQLDEAALERTLPLVAAGLDRYCWLQAELAKTDVTRDHAFQVRFNAFYRVRRGARWRSAFYLLLEQEKSKRRPFAAVLRALHEGTGRVEASFASKLVASVDPKTPVIDAFVLMNLGLRLPRAGSIESRLGRTAALHDQIWRIYADYLDSASGRRLVRRFEETYPSCYLTGVKMLDLILWKSRRRAGSNDENLAQQGPGSEHHALKCGRRAGLPCRPPGVRPAA